MDNRKIIKIILDREYIPCDINVFLSLSSVVYLIFF